jgi:hypothetical protein
MDEILNTFFSWPWKIFSFLYPTNFLEIYGVGSIILFLVTNMLYLLIFPNTYCNDNIFTAILHDLTITLFIILVIIGLPIFTIILEVVALLYIIYIIVFIIPRYLVRMTLIEVGKDETDGKLYFRKSELKSLGKDKYGELFDGIRFEIESQYDISIKINHYILVKVENSTKKDGKKKEYYLQVPIYFGDGNHTPKEAVAWTFGLKEDEYNPELES